MWKFYSKLLGLLICTKFPLLSHYVYMYTYIQEMAKFPFLSHTHTIYIYIGERKVWKQDMEIEKRTKHKRVLWPHFDRVFFHDLIDAFSATPYDFNILHVVPLLYIYKESIWCVMLWRFFIRHAHMYSNWMCFSGFHNFLIFPITSLLCIDNIIITYFLYKYVKLGQTLCG